MPTTSRFTVALALLAAALVSSSPAAPVLLNEFNAVSSSSTLIGGGTDSRFGSVAGNGGDWFELVVVGGGPGATVDLRGWRIEVQREAGTTFVAEATLFLSSDPYWAAVPVGTILTFTEDRTAEGGMDTTLGATDNLNTEGWAHSNIWIGDPVLTVYTDEETNGYTIDAVDGVNGFNINDRDTQFRISNSAGTVVFGPVGEGIKPVRNDINSDEIFALQQTPSSVVVPVSDYGDSSIGVDNAAYSTFGRPNRWSVAGELFEQSFAGFLAGGAPPVFLSSQTDTSVLAGTTFTYPLQAFDADGEQLVLSMVEGPAFLTVGDNGNGTGSLAGTPTDAQAGTHRVRLRVADNNQGVHEQLFLLTVLPATSPVIVNEYNAVSSTTTLGEPWSFDQRFGLVKGNGGDWIELVVVGDGTAGSTVDMRGWRIEVVEKGLPEGTIVLSTDGAWQAVQAGTILTFTESNALNGGWDTSLLAENRLAVEGWAWSNIHLQDATLIDLAQSSSSLRLTGDQTRITILDADAAVVAGPYGEAIYSAGRVNNSEVFRFAANPFPGAHPLTPQFGDADTSTFGHPNRLPENDGSDPLKPAGSGTGYQSFVAFATGAGSAAPYFTSLWGSPDLNNTLPGATWTGPAISALDPDHSATALSFSLDSAPAGLGISSSGDGSAVLQWTPTAGQTGVHEVVVRVSDPAGAFLTRSFEVAVIPASSSVLVNEYNAVDDALFLNGGTEALDENGGVAADSFFGRVAGNGGDWIELVVTGNGAADSTVDMRGWKIKISEDRCPPETVVLTQDPYWSAVRAGTILTFVEKDLLGGGMNSAVHRVNRFQDLGYAWTNIALNDPAFVDQVLSDFGSSIPVNSSELEITLLDKDGSVVCGPLGETRITRNVSNDEIFHLERDPAPSVTASVADPGFPNYSDHDDSSSFGAPNRWVASDGVTEVTQGFTAYLSSVDTNSRPFFMQLPTFLYGVPGKTGTQPVAAGDADGVAGLNLSLINAPAWASLVDDGGGSGSVLWSPPAGTEGFHDMTLVVSDGIHAVEHSFRVFVHPTPSGVILNEYNSVSSDSFLNGGTLALDSEGGAAADRHFGRVAGNGGDWLELAVVGDDHPGTSDLRGWSIEVGVEAGFPFEPDAVIRLSNDPFWAAVPHGMILTFIEEPTARGGMDTSLRERDEFSTEGWGWSNIWIGDPQLITYTSALENGYELDPVTGWVKNFAISGSRTHVVIRDAGGSIVFGPGGEGVSPLGGVSSRTVWHYQRDPRSTSTPLDAEAVPSARRSSFGHPNAWDGGAAEQDFSVFVSSPFASYVASFGLSGSDALFDADPDGDGDTNGREFALGSDPSDGTSRPDIRAALLESTVGVIFLRRAGGSVFGDSYQVDGVAMTIDFSTDLVTWIPRYLPGSNPPGLPAPPPGYEYVTLTFPPEVFAANPVGGLRIRVTEL